MNPSEMTYAQALAELKGINEQLRRDDCDLEKLTALVERATALLNECDKRLTTNEESLRAMLDKLAQQ